MSFSFKGRLGILNQLSILTWLTSLPCQEWFCCLRLLYHVAAGSALPQKPLLGCWSAPQKPGCLLPSPLFIWSNINGATLFRALYWLPLVSSCYLLTPYFAPPPPIPSSSEMTFPKYQNVLFLIQTWGPSGIEMGVLPSFLIQMLSSPPTLPTHTLILNKLNKYNAWGSESKQHQKQSVSSTSDRYSARN